MRHRTTTTTGYFLGGGAGGKSVVMVSAAEVVLGTLAGVSVEFAEEFIAGRVLAEAWSITVSTSVTPDAAEIFVGKSVEATGEDSDAAGCMVAPVAVAAIVVVVLVAAVIAAVIAALAESSAVCMGVPAAVAAVAVVVLVASDIIGD